MKKQTQYGKGMAGFISGLLLATAVIVGILFFLNKGNQNQFKEQAQSEQTSEPEILQPPAVSKPADEPAPQASQPDGSASGTEAVDDTEVSPGSDTSSSRIDEDKPDTPEIVPVPTPKPATEPKASDVAQDDRDAAERAAQEREERAAAQQRAAEAKRQADAAKKRAEQAKADKAAADKKAAELKAKQKAESGRKAADKKAEAKKEAERKAVKPTPEQILNSGSIEKARKAAGEEAKKAAESSAKSGSKAAASKSSGKKVIVQMGSYADRASADTQRAKLAMMGVQASVVEGSANGKQVYRLQSGSMTQDAAQRLQQTLKKNGVSSFTRSAQ